MSLSAWPSTLTLSPPRCASQGVCTPRPASSGMSVHRRSHTAGRHTGLVRRYVSDAKFVSKAGEEEEQRNLRRQVPREQEVIKSQIMSAEEGQQSVGGAETEKRELDQIRQMIRAISQSGNVLRDGKCYFLPVQFGAKGRDIKRSPRTPQQV
ncbi:hypothetical protein F2P81_016053 [Scophthalmus maximus]|uniref:Uncharacterized protein n=1 Tax=Scophthalmus maximus TaxID=52904 RepID=A0A6A4SH13_SCOMX|nr:hypothetical protein F2P81_016053 [Scophthalmus maximus]